MWLDVLMEIAILCILPHFHAAQVHAYKHSPIDFLTRIEKQKYEIAVTQHSSRIMFLIDRNKATGLEVRESQIWNVR